MNYKAKLICAMLIAVSSICVAADHLAVHHAPRELKPVKPPRTSKEPKSSDTLQVFFVPQAQFNLVTRQADRLADLERREADDRAKMNRRIQNELNEHGIAEHGKSAQKELQERERERVRETQRTTVSLRLAAATAHAKAQKKKRLRRCDAASSSHAMEHAQESIHVSSAPSTTRGKSEILPASIKPRSLSQA